MLGEVVMPPILCSLVCCGRAQLRAQDVGASCLWRGESREPPFLSPLGPHCPCRDRRVLAPWRGREGRTEGTGLGSGG